VVQTVPMTIPLGGRAAMSVGAGPPRHEDRVGSEGAFVTRVEGPADAATVTNVRLIKRGGGVLALAAAPAAAEPAAFAAAEQTLALPLFGAAALATLPGPVSATKIRNTGNDSNRLVIAILGDGFTQSNLNSGVFSNKVSGFFNTFFSTSPWNNYS